jgi:hypothetical protein
VLEHTLIRTARNVEISDANPVSSLTETHNLMPNSHCNLGCKLVSRKLNAHEQKYMKSATAITQKLTHRFWSNLDPRKTHKGKTSERGAFYYSVLREIMSFLQQ